MPENNSLYQQLFNNSRESQLILKEGKIIQCNQATLSMFGYKNREDILGKHPSELSPDMQPDGSNSNTKAKKKITTALKTESNRFEWVHKKQNGETFPVEVLLTKLKDGESIIVHASMHDISKNKKISNELIESENRFKQLSNLSFEGIIIHDMGMAIDVNLALEKISGYTRDEIVGHNILEIFVSDKYKSIVKDEIVKNRTTPYHIEALHKKGHLVPIEIESRNITIKKRKVRVTAIRDLSERKKYQIEFEKSREQYKKAYELFRLMLDTTTDMIWAKDMEGNFTFTNKAICENLINAKNVEEPIGKHVMYFVNRERTAHPENNAWFTFGEECGDSDAITIKNKKVSRFIEYGNVFGKNLILEVIKAPLWNEKGEMIGTVGSARDITQRKEAEDKLKLSEERYRMLFENGPDPIIIHDGKVILDVNTATLLKLDFQSKADVIGNDVLTLVHPDDRPKAISRMKKMLENSIPLETEEFRIITLDGKEIITLASPSPITFNGNPAFMVTYHDITNRKKAEQAIREKENQFHTVVEAAPDAIFLIDYYTTNIILANKQASLITGYSNKELLNLAIMDIHPLFNDDLYRNRLREKIKEEKTISLEMDITHKNGNTNPAEVIVTFLLYNGRKALLGFVKDITDRKANEKALQESQESFKTLSDITFEGILIHENGVAIDMNLSLPKMFGYTKEELLGKNMIQLLTAKESLPLIYANINKEHAKSYRVTGIKKDGTRFPLELEAKSITLNNNQSIRVAAFRDISDRVKSETKMKELNELLQRQNKKLEKLNNELEAAKLKAEESDRLKSAFLANMSHEIRTPMNGILGFSTLLKNINISTQERLTYLNVIEQSGNRLLNIINDLVDISKIEAGQMTVSHSKCNVTKHLAALYTFFKREAEQKNLELILQPQAKKETLTLVTDEDKLVAILTNLIKNALKYTKEGSVMIGFHRVKGFVEFFVKDTGIGIAKERQQAIFERFVQADIEDRDVYEGSGLGLAISKAYITMLGGDIRLESEEGKGSAFYFTLPDNTDEATSQPIEEPERVIINEAKFPKLNILIVEDEVFSDQLLTVSLKKITKNIYHATSGVQAIELFKQHPDIDLIMMDIKMRGMDGHKATNEIRKLDKDVVIIAQTAYALMGDKEKALAAGCNDYIAKPIIKKEVLKVISKYFNY
ncbi:MAG: hypothetical protein DRJ09_07865 [Bacteroidetes bacterium]|nr:MAG: hypothetical protein DRJ09_07865 [Bacteroidota bacterium]